ncbi:DUF6911 family protein [Kalamiella sp. sgz302252]|uniref:DUF6911 family protein n=1 Tax=Pantoea sp. sgz302252 TaxID=3341827 RepID=UPI0036D27489
MLITMSWTLNGYGGNDNHPLWNAIQIKLAALRNGYGTLTLDIHDNDEGPQLLQIRAEAGNYLLMLGEIINDDYEVRSYFDKKKSNNKINILGDYWPENQITTDFSFVTKVFSEFFHTGDVREIMLN